MPLHLLKIVHQLWISLLTVWYINKHGDSGITIYTWKAPWKWAGIQSVVILIHSSQLIWSPESSGIGRALRFTHDLALFTIPIQ